MKRSKIWLAVGLVSGLVVAGTSALAADTNPPATNDNQQSQTAPQEPCKDSNHGEGKGHGKGKHGQGKHGMQHGMSMGQKGQDHTALLDLLQMDEQAFKEARQAGKSIVEIAAEKGISEQQVLDTLVKEASQRLDDAVASGKMTQEQATAMKDKMTERIKQMIEKKGTHSPK